MPTQKVLDAKANLEDKISAKLKKYHGQGERRSRGAGAIAACALLAFIFGVAFVLVGSTGIFPPLGRLAGGPLQAIGYGILLIIISFVIAGILDLWPMNEKGQYYRTRAREFENYLSDVKTLQIETMSEEEALATIRALDNKCETRVTQITENSPIGKKPSSTLASIHTTFFSSLRQLLP